MFSLNLPFFFPEYFATAGQDFLYTLRAQVLTRHRGGGKSTDFFTSSSSFNDSDIVFGDQLISRHQGEFLDDGLSNQHSVERVFMDAR